MDPSNVDTDAVLPDATARPAAPAPDRLSVVQEFAHVEKRTVDTGRGTRLRKIVHDEVVQVVESLATDEFTVERRPIDRVVASAPPVRHEGDTMIVPVLAERVVTRIELVLVEELHVTRIERHLPFTKDVTLRREEIVVERFDERAGPAGPIERTTTLDQ